MRFDVAIVGGGVMGCALGFWLTRLDRERRVCIVERDPAWTRASSALSAASIRQQFGTAINIRISQASLELLRRPEAWLGIPHGGVDFGLRENGYLYLSGPGHSDGLRALHRVQREHGAPVVLLEPQALRARFPWLSTQGIALGSLGEAGEGWFDGHALLSALRDRARIQGVRFKRGEVSSIRLRSGAPSSQAGNLLELADGAPIEARLVVNCAGPWAGHVARRAGLDLPVHARRRTVHVIECPTPIPDCPLIIDPSGYWIRPEGRQFIAGWPPAGDDADDLPLEPELADFEENLWPQLAARIPAFEAARHVRAWAGYYEMNVFDQNGIVGPHREHPDFMLLTGFSGHGIQQAPVVARGLAELIVHGAYRSIDLTPLGHERITAGRPLVEPNVIG